MNARAAKRVVTTALVAILLSGGLVWADDGQEEVRRLQQSGEILPLEDILKEAHWQRYRRLLEADLAHREGRYYYELELLDERGVVWKERFDAASGEPLTRGRK
ncbi:MAG: hypothetical protein WCC36_01350 [Gammaproteobacteria bacterium]